MPAFTLPHCNRYCTCRANPPEARAERISDGARTYGNVPMSANAPVFIVNHGTTQRPAYQSLSSFILNLPGVYCVLRDRADCGNHRRENLKRA
jgi:hypothetical protein